MISQSGARILFISTHAYIPQRTSGLAQTMHELCVEFVREGLQPIVAAHLRPGDKTWLFTRVRALLNSTSFPRTTDLGYPVHLGYDPGEHLDELLELTKPDCIFVQSPECGPLVEKTRNCGLPVFVYFHDNEIKDLQGNPADWSWVRFIANSQFTRDHYARECGIQSTVVYPLITLDDSHREPGGDQVLFINPIAPKGSHIAFEIARRLPQVNFLFQESWPLNGEQLADVEKQLQTCPNVTFQRRTTDRNKFFGKAKVLLVPSLWLEGYGRVAVEAQAEGIPVVASNRGALAEAVGEGGAMIANPENVDEWIPVIERLMTDRAYYQKLSAAAHQNVARPEFSRDYIVNTLIELLTGKS